MKIEKVLKTGQPGTKKWVEKYGEKLICIRYRTDNINKRRLKTIEIIVNETPIRKRRKKFPPNKLISIKVNYNDLQLRKIVKSAGGKWNSTNKVWELPYCKIVDLGLEKNITENS